MCPHGAEKGLSKASKHTGQLGPFSCSAPPLLSAANSSEEGVGDVSALEILCRFFVRGWPVMRSNSAGLLLARRTAVRQNEARLR